MATERQIQEVVARCVSTMVYYHNIGRSPRTTERMAAEVAVVAGFVEELGLSIEGVEDLIIRPVEVELTNRYGHELGPRLLGEFLGGFDGTAVDGVRIRRGDPGND